MTIANETKAGRQFPLLPALKFLVADRLGIVLLVWMVLAFGVRPALLNTGLEPSSPTELQFFARMKGMAQVLSFSGAILVAALVHVRFAASAPLLAAKPNVRFMIAAGYAVVMAVAYAVFFWTPASVFTLIAHDSMIFIDSSYRILQGQRPSVDFPTALGAACLYPLAFVAWLTGSYGGSMELASAMVALFLGVACAHVGAKRFTPLVTVTLIVIIFLVAVPASMLDHWGDESLTMMGKDRFEHLADDLTYAMFYNRWGWSALIVIFAYLSPIRGGGQPSRADILVFSAVLAFCFWLKLTYFAVGIGAAAIYAFANPKPWRTLATGVGGTLALILVVSLATGNLFAYVHDTLQAGRISGGRSDLVLPLIRSNFLDIIVAGSVLGVMSASRLLTKKDILIGAFIILGNVFIINQNGQFQGLAALLTLGAYAVARCEQGGAEPMARLAAVGAFLLMAATPLISRSFSMIDQAYAVQREAARPPAPWSAVPAFKGVYVPERESFLDRVTVQRAPEDARNMLWVIGTLKRRAELRQGEYMETLLAGMNELKAVIKPGESVATLDMSNPFPFMLNARAPEGAWLTMHKDRTLSEDVHPEPTTLFFDTDHVMVPKKSMVPDTPDLALELYADWLDAHYGQRVETDYWTRWSHRKPGWGKATKP